jgi:uncharacterized protein YndB with AHSA1/START domain
MTQDDAQVLDGTVISANGRNDVFFDRHYDASAQELWPFVSDPERMKGWIGGPVEKLELKVGGDAVIHIHPAGGATVHGKVLTYEPGRLIELTWDVPAWGKIPDLLGTTMRWEVLPDGDGSRLLLTHSIPEEQGRVPMFLGAWHAHLDELADALKGKEIPPFEDQRMFAMRAKYEAQLGQAS